MTIEEFIEKYGVEADATLLWVNEQAGSHWRVRLRGSDTDLPFWSLDGNFSLAQFLQDVVYEAGMLLAYKTVQELLLASGYTDYQLAVDIHKGQEQTRKTLVSVFGRKGYAELRGVCKHASSCAGSARQRGSHGSSRS